MNMNPATNQLFDNALSLQEPWFVENVVFESDKKLLNIFVNFKRGSKFSPSDSENGEQFKVHDTIQKNYRHLNFFEHECRIHCRVPGIKTDDNKVILIKPPFAGLNPGFTLLFEALLIEMCRNMPVNAVSKLIDEHDDKIWRVPEKYIDSAKEHQDLSQLQNVGVDETGRAKGHQYISLFVDLDRKKTVFVAEGKDSGTVSAFSGDLKEHQGDVENIKNVSCDMSPAFIKGVTENFPDAEITFDKFHIVKIINEAVDQVRRQETSANPILKGSRYAVLKNEENRTKKDHEKLNEPEMSKLNLKTVKAMQIRENFQEIYNAETLEDFILLLKKWYFRATHSRTEPIIKAAKTIKKHRDGVLNWKNSQINNGILEGLNSVIQAAKSKARGYKTLKNLKIIAYLITGNLNFEILNPHLNN